MIRLQPHRLKVYVIACCLYCDRLLQILTSVNLILVRMMVYVRTYLTITSVHVSLFSVAKNAPCVSYNINIIIDIYNKWTILF